MDSLDAIKKANELLQPWIYGTKAGEEMKKVEKALEQQQENEEYKRETCRMDGVERNRRYREHPERFK